MQEILLGVQGDAKLNARFHPTLQKLRNLHNQQWLKLFIDISDQQIEAVKQFAFATPRGLALGVTMRSSAEATLAAKQSLKTSMYIFFLHPRQSTHTTFTSVQLCITQLSDIKKA